MDESVVIAADGVGLAGFLQVPRGARGLVLFAHGSGSSAASPRNAHVARRLREARLGTLLFDLLTIEEVVIDAATRALRFDIALLTRRLEAATRWAQAQPALAPLPLGYFGASTGAAAALCAAGVPPIRAVVSRGGRPDLADAALPGVRAATLLIVGGLDIEVLALNRGALAGLTGCEAQLVVVPAATHLFEEPGALEQVSALAADWLGSHLGSGGRCIRSRNVT